MKNQQAKTKAFVASALLSMLVACGGGGSTTSPTTTTPTPTPTPTPVVQLNGVFVDAPVKGLCYTASPSGLNGMTDATGAYRYVAGDTVSFGLPNAGSCASPVNLGSTQPSNSDAAKSETTFVLSLPNGERVAQVLHTVNTGSMQVMDVSAAALPASQSTAITNFIQSGPAAGSSTQAVLGTIQTGVSAANPTATFTTPVNNSFTAVVQAHLGQSASSTLPASSIDPTLGRGKPIVSFSDAGLVTGLAFTNSNDIRYSVGTSTATISTSTISNRNANTFVSTRTGGGSATVVVQYQDALGGITSATPYSSSGAATTPIVSSFKFLTPLTRAAVAGKTTTVPVCGDNSNLTFRFSADGSSALLGSSTTTTSIQEIPELPGILKFFETNGAAVYVGLIGSSIDAVGATMYFIDTNNKSSGQVRVVANPSTPASCPQSSTNTGNTTTTTIQNLQTIGAPTTGLVSLKSNSTLTTTAGINAYDTVQWSSASFTSTISVFATTENPASFTTGYTFVPVSGTVYFGVGSFAQSSSTQIPLNYPMPASSVWAVVVDEINRAKWGYVQIR